MQKDIAVLVVDDFRTMTKIICSMLQEIGFTDVDHVHDGYSALDRLHAKNFGLVLCDWEMQPINGKELMERMRGDARTADIPVILVTAKVDQDGSWLAGADGYLTKPFNAAELEEAIDGVIGRKQGAASLAG